MSKQLDLMRNTDCQKKARSTLVAALIKVLTKKTCFY